MEYHKETVQHRLAEKLTEYLNYCTHEETKLLFDQNLLQQIYIPKDDSDWRTFHNSRPITKTSPLYKLLDTILNEILQKELYEGRKRKLNPG